MHFCMGLMAELCSSAASDSLFFLIFFSPAAAPLGRQGASRLFLSLILCLRSR
jgi:hypothetical protein|uniref:Uncharacterized protein n=1 Tax=Zea mays TaxID=4577 RepID=B6TMX8_MAIZE|nr:hypothetical protein [Zea mays]